MQIVQQHLAFYTAMMVFSMKICPLLKSPAILWTRATQLPRMTQHGTNSMILWYAWNSLPVGLESTCQL
jgi:hypothetical protein